MPRAACDAARRVRLVRAGTWPGASSCIGRAMSPPTCSGRASVRPAQWLAHGRSSGAGAAGVRGECAYNCAYTQSPCGRPSFRSLRSLHVGDLGVDRPAMVEVVPPAAPHRCPPEIHTKVRRRSAIPPSFRSLRSLHVAGLLHVAHLRIDFLRCPTGPHRYSWPRELGRSVRRVCRYVVCHPSLAKRLECEVESIFLV